MYRYQGKKNLTIKSLNYMFPFTSLEMPKKFILMAIPLLKNSDNKERIIR